MYYGGKRIFLPLLASRAGLFSDLSVGDTGPLCIPGTQLYIYSILFVSRSAPPVFLSQFTTEAQRTQRLFFFGQSGDYDWPKSVLL